MEFKKYQHLERFGTTEVENIELGYCYVFPKIDGTNASIWLDDNGDIQSGSRRRHLTLDNDNAGFYEWVLNQRNILEYLNSNPTHRLFGEWLVPHSLKTYRDDCWNNFYVFDVVEDTEEDFKYLNYESYKVELDRYNISYIPPICTAKNATYDQFINQLDKNIFLVKNGEGFGEGIVIKNYDFKNKYGRTVWAKIISSEFKEKHAKEMGGHHVKGSRLIEEEIADKYVTKALCEKIYSKIENESGFSSRNIPQLLNTVFYDVVKEECWNFVKEHKYPTINFSTLKHFVIIKTKEHFPTLF